MLKNVKGELEKIEGNIVQIKQELFSGRRKDNGELVTGVLTTLVRYEACFLTDPLGKLDERGFIPMFEVKRDSLSLLANNYHTLSLEDFHVINNNTFNDFSNFINEIKVFKNGIKTVSGEKLCVSSDLGHAIKDVATNKQPIKNNQTPHEYVWDIISKYYPLVSYRDLTLGKRVIEILNKRKVGNTVDNLEWVRNGNN